MSILHFHYYLGKGFLNYWQWIGRLGLQIGTCYNIWFILISQKQARKSREKCGNYTLAVEQCTVVWVNSRSRKQAWEVGSLFQKILIWFSDKYFVCFAEEIEQHCVMGKEKTVSALTLNKWRKLPFSRSTYFQLLFSFSASSNLQTEKCNSHSMKWELKCCLSAAGGLYFKLAHLNWVVQEPFNEMYFELRFRNGS